MWGSVEPGPGTVEAGLLRGATAQAAALAHRHVGAEHAWLAVLAGDQVGPVLRLVLAERGVSLDDVHQQVLAAATAPTRPPTPTGGAGAGAAAGGGPGGSERRRPTPRLIAVLGAARVWRRVLGGTAGDAHLLLGLLEEWDQDVVSPLFARRGVRPGDLASAALGVLADGATDRPGRG